LEFSESNAYVTNTSFVIWSQEFSAYYALFAATNNEVLCFLCYVLARYSKNDKNINPRYTDSVIEIIKHELLPLIRSLAWNYHPRVQSLAREILANLKDPEFESIKTIGSWIKTFKVQNPDKVGNTLTNAEIDMELLLDTNISLEMIKTSFSKLNISEGAQLRIISGVTILRAQLIKAQSDMDIIAATKAKTDSNLHKKAPLERQQSKGLIIEDIDVFISYSWANKPMVQKLKNSLENSGLKCWMDEQQMKGGELLFSEIDHGVSTAAVFVACVSNQYGESENCKRELRLASDRKKILLPVWVSNCDPYPPRGDMGPLLAGRIYINVSNDDLLQQNSPQLVTALKQAIDNFSV